MKIAITIDGIEPLISSDLEGKQILPKRIEFESSNRLQGVNTIYELIDRFKFKSLEDVKEKVSKLNFNLQGTFKVLCNREGSHKFKSITAEQEVGEVIYNKGFKVDLKNPQTIIFLDILDDNCLLGYLEKYNLAKRPYRFKINNQSLNALLAYSLIKFSDIKREDSLLDPFCRDSIIPLEAYFYGIKQIYALDFLKNNIYNSNINIKLAKASIELKEYKISELSSVIKEVDYIITQPPYPTSLLYTSSLKKVLPEFFSESHKILKKSMILITTKPELIEECSKNLFKIESNFNASIGNINYTILKMLPR